MPDRPFVTSAGIVDRSGRDKLCFTGDQALWFCDQLLSNKVVDLADGSGADALLLTPHGRITALVRLLHAGDEILADMEPGLAAPMLAFFEGRIFATRVQIADVTHQRGQLSVFGPGADATVARALGVDPADLPGPEEHATVRIGSRVVARVVRPAGGLDLLMATEEVPALLAALEEAGATAASEADYESLRVRVGLVRDRLDIDESFLPQEAALERAVHFAKGCYLGQEAVAMTQRGRIKRRVRHLAFEGAPAPGIVWFGGEEVGRVTSVTTDADPRHEIAYGIATVRTAVALDQHVVVGPSPNPEDALATALVAELPGTVAGPSVPSARELRERLAGGAPART